MQKKEYFSWIDILKGLGIILVILGHLRVSYDVLNYIYLFHMPLFFFISGYLMNVKKYDSLYQLIKKKSKTLLIPYLTLSVVSIIVYSIIGESDIDISQAFQSLIEGKRNEIYYNVPLWFLTGLFVVEVVYYILKKNVRNDVILLILIIIINFIAVVYLNVIENPNWIWSIDTAFYYLLYYQLGNLFKIYIKDIRWSLNKILMGAVLLICVSFNIILLISPDQIQFVYSYIHAKKEFLFIWLIICAISGIVTYIALSMFIKNSNTLEYIGKNSLIIFALHYPIGILILDKLKMQLELNIIHSNILSILELTLILFLLKPVVRNFNEKFSYLLGKF